MGKSAGKSRIPSRPEWARTISDLRQRLNLSQTDFGHRLNSSAISVSRWERGVSEPPSGSYIELGNLSDAALCRYFWGRAGISHENLLRAMRDNDRYLDRTHSIRIQVAHAGSGAKKSEARQLVAIPLLKAVVASHGERSGSESSLHDAPVESMIAAPRGWCPSPATTTCLRVKGNSMKPLIYDGYILVVDTSQTDHAKLDGEIVIAWHRAKGLAVSRLEAYDHTEVLRAENAEHGSVVIGVKHQWKIVAKVLWWIGKDANH